VLTKVSSLIQQNYSNLKSVLGIQSANISAIKNLNPINAPNFNSQQVTAAAAKILNKSPLEADFDVSNEHLKQNPYQYGVVYYPSNIPELGAGHYMMFDIFLNNKTKFLKNDNKNTTLTTLTDSEGVAGGKIVVSKFAVDKGRIFGGNLNKITSQFQATNALGYSSLPRSTGIQASHNTHTFISDTIILYTPPQVKTNYGTSYDTPETGTTGQAFGASTGFLDSIKSIAGVGFREFTLGIVSGLPGAGDAAGALVKRNAEARNPNLEVVFKSVPFRKFEYTFEFAPRNKEEVISVDKILKLFRYHMQPSLQGGSSSFFDVPSEFQLTYMYIDKQNSYIPKISRCVLENMEIDQSPEGVFTTFRSDEKGAFPTLTTMKLSFTETEIMTKQKIADGF
jgi:hypothetical protein